MHYLIAEKVIFDDIEFALKNDSTNDRIPLPAAAGYILSILITSQGAPVDREFIMDYAWDRFGVQISPNTINQYVSLLRKNIAKLGGPELFIKTIPRVGFIIDTSIRISTEKSLLPFKKKVKRFEQYKDFIFFTLALLSILLGGGMAYSLKQITEPHPPQKNFLGEENGCKVYSFEQTRFEEQAAYHLAKDLMLKYLPCRNGGIYSMDYTYDVDHEKINRIYLSRCKNNKSNIGSVCKEIIIYVDN